MKNKSMKNLDWLNRVAQPSIFRSPGPAVVGLFGEWVSPSVAVMENDMMGHSSDKPEQDITEESKIIEPKQIEADEK